MASFWEKLWGNESRLGKWSLRRSNAQDDRSARVAGSSLLTRFLAWANNQFNPEHDWFDYSSMDNTFNSVKNQFTQGDLTGAQKAANQFSAEEAQKNRDWQQYMSNTSYQRAVKDMQAAGINPALAMSQGGASTPSGSSASSVSPSGNLSMSDLMQVLMMPLQKKLLKAQAQQASDQGLAALMQGRAALRNAGSQERQAGVAEMNAETARMRQEVDAWVARSNISLNDEQKSYLAEQTARLKIENAQLPERLEILKRQVSAQEKQAAASLQAAIAANRNAAVNEKLQPLQAELYKAQAYVEWLNGDGKVIANRYLDERQRQELYNLEQEGIKLNKQGDLIDRQGKLVTAQKWKTYVNCVTDASGAINQWANPFSKGPGSNGLSFESANASFSPMF